MFQQYHEKIIKVPDTLLYHSIHYLLSFTFQLPQMAVNSASSIKVFSLHYQDIAAGGGRKVKGVYLLLYQQLPMIGSLALLPLYFIVLLDYKVHLTSV